jgi:hypothetical protein
MRTKSDREKISIKKMIREKQITIIKIRTKVDIKIKLNQILRDEIEKKRFKTKYIAIKSLRTKFDIISK